jgi:hypothetical protein
MSEDKITKNDASEEPAIFMEWIGEIGEKLT